MNQDWKDVAGYEGLYQVSNDGQVKSLSNDKGKKEKLLRQSIRAKHYPSVALSKRGMFTPYSVHRLVAEAFLSNPDGFPEVNHKDENPYNNHVDNLEWCTHKYNINYTSGRKTYKKRGHAREIIQLDLYGKTISVFKSTADAANSTGIGRTGISNALSRIDGTSGGYGWQYAN